MSKVRLAERGYLKGQQVLDEATIAGVCARLPLLFRGEFDTGVYPDEMHWREGISRDDAPREVSVSSVSLHLPPSLPPNCQRFLRI